ncbi:MAG: ATP-binding protein [Bacteroidales bacterium]|nr:ATP-binding protein [Bacteroidales bacterium]MCF8338384.1 ATP-binding protein [Bacteroidales bacterium]
MELNIKSKLLNAIGQIYEQSKGCGLTDGCLEEMKPNEDIIAEYLQVSPVQAFFFANIFALNYNGDRANLEDLTDFFSCNPMRLLEFSHEIESLVEKNYIKKVNSRLKKMGTPNSHLLSVNDKIVYAILNNQSLPHLKPQIDSVIDVLERIYELGVKRMEQEINTMQLFSHTRGLLEANSHFKLIRRVSSFHLSIEHNFLFLYLIWKTLSGRESVDMETALDGMFEEPADRIKEMQSLINGDHDLVKQNLVEIEEASFLKDTSLKLTEYASTMLQKEGLTTLSYNQQKEAIKPERLAQKKMFYNQKEQERIDLIQNLLDEDRLNEVQVKLKEKELPKGFTVLLHGEPGTGKTETVYQIAKTTQREIIKVDLSSFRSKWFGESEKNIRNIFSKYRRYLLTSERLPILLLNEADGIISRRKEVSDSNTAQTENLMQNILLEELENFEGILLATSNLIRNFDRAFERRFLFKVELQKPGLPVRAKIWKAKLPLLTFPECEKLAKQFDFSGGQIDNIASKCLMYEIIHNTRCNDSVMEFCREETLNDTGREKIGFNKN